MHAKINTTQIWTFCFLFLTLVSDLKAMQLSKVGLSTSGIKSVKIWHHGQMPLEPKTHENANYLHEFVHKGCFKMSTICMDTCLETLSKLVNCSVDNVSRHMPVQMVFKFPKVMRQHTSGVVGKLIWILLEICHSLQQWKMFTNRLRIDTVIGMVTLAQFFWLTVYIIVPKSQLGWLNLPHSPTIPLFVTA